MSEAAILPGAGAPRPVGRALAWIAFLGPFFYLTYGTANWLAASRAQVPAIVFDWEHDIPFVAWTIIPYWTSNVFYGASVFLCRTPGELDTLGRRLVSAQVIAVSCFILFPLHFTFTQPATDGLPGFLFASLNSFDKPFNQAPSLHIALLVIYWAFYPRYVRGPWQWLLHLWFVLIGVSVLTTYQHHFIDIPTGVLAGVICVWLWPEEGASPLAGIRLARDPRRWRLAAYYAVGAALVASLALGIGGGALWLQWPAVSLLMVAINYGLLGEAGFQKDGVGAMTLAARLLYAPYLLGAWINSRAWTRTHPLPVAITGRVALGRMPSAEVARKFRFVVDLAAELPRSFAHDGWQASPILDLVVPEPRALRAVAGRIELAQREGQVLVCCALGFSRSAAAVATWLVRFGGAPTTAAAVERIRQARPEIVLSPAWIRAIEAAASQP